MYNYNEFLVWCQTNNSNTIAFDKSPINLNKLSKFIKKKYNNKKLLEDIYQMETIYNNMENTNSSKTYLLTTSRLTICEST